MANLLISQLDVYGPGHCPKLSGWLCDPVGEDEECPYIFSSSWGVRRTVGSVAESDVDRLVEEDDIGMFGPTIQVVFSEGGRGGRRGDVLRFAIEQE
jgi:hypothetical protein